ncbi:MAG: glycoside hydrolase family 57 [Chloroflexaceae bacterium]|nr:glycoside hydrolase family 57 [Chloroflexaceae bacterium]
MGFIYHALVLNLHQPAGNLEHLLEHAEWEAREILWALDRIPRSVWPYEDIARVHLSLSGTLLETLSNPEFQSRVYGTVKCGDLLWHFQNTGVFEILGTGYYHPVLPLIPQADWDAQLERWLGIGRHLFSRGHFRGFWPPEMGFCMEMIPLLKRMGYEYVLVDSKHVEPVDPMNWEEIRYRPHIAEYGGHEIIVVVRDRELSDAQESGMNYGWFEHELHERTRWCNFPPLVTTCTDGDNGGWFRNTTPKGNFWHVFYEDFLGQVRREETAGRPILISEYLDRFGAHGRVKVNTGAWNTGWHHGVGFVQWTGSQKQKDAFQRVQETSEAFHATRQELGDQPLNDLRRRYQMEEAHWHLLRAETSCNFYWGEDWVDRCHRDLDITWLNLNEAKK